MDEARMVAQQVTVRLINGGTPPDGWQPGGLKWSIREKLKRVISGIESPIIDTTNHAQP
jgi:hypothetical protein